MLRLKFLKFNPCFLLQLRKRIWKTLIQAKIRAQAKVLVQTYGEDFGLLKMIQKVKSGDTSNIEGQVARRYWSKLFGTHFRRDYEASDENAMLNYGYALMRGIVARGICASGLHPSLGNSSSSSL